MSTKVYFCVYSNYLLSGAIIEAYMQPVYFCVYSNYLLSSAIIEAYMQLVYFCVYSVYLLSSANIFSFFHFRAWHFCKFRFAWIITVLIIKLFPKEIFLFFSTIIYIFIMTFKPFYSFGCLLFELNLYK